MRQREPIFHSAVFVLLRSDNKYLLQRRKNTGFMDGHYDTTVTGHVEREESIYFAAIRETKEEVGVRVAESDLQLVMAVQANLKRHYLNYVFICDKWEGEPTICEPEKCDSLEWFTLDSMPEKLTSTMQLMVSSGFSEELRFRFVDQKLFDTMLEGSYLS